ncbi:type IV secretory pathway TraG/TraD family ATPase VirD4 [Peribacillus simplex]|uniref:VirD4-like conjugal transfer protein, CD1115 family n=1 Tax=Peribacillus simplex TaxID=1478 RepID=UPI0024E1F975|nr:type IV secretory system conjugative DNA transfer family protein [Peribacillus simplex]MDF9763792.1 type IV secretory pathway TraG/TraD family ATPase VirD4 [Peribacillus simplex]
MGSVYNLASCRMDVIRYLFNRFPREHIVRRAYQSAIANLGEKTGPDVFITLMQTLNPWQYEDVCRFTETNDFLFEDLGQKKMIVYVIMPIADNEFRPLITTFFTQLFSELYRLAGMNQGRLPNNVWLALDEFANIGKIPDFETRLSTTRSLGIEVSIILQDLAQLESRYGKDLAKEIISNCDTRILLKANEVDTAKYFSRLAGKTTIRIKNNSSSKSSKSSSKSESVQYTGRDLVTEQEILNMQHNHQLLFISGNNPMLVKKAWFFKIKEFKNMLGKDVSRSDYKGSERLDYQVFIPPTVDEINAEIEKEQIAEAMEKRKKITRRILCPF